GNAGRPGAPREEEPVLAVASARPEPVVPRPAEPIPRPPRLREATSASSLPPPDLGMPASRRTEAPPVSPANADQGRDGWLSDLLSRADSGDNDRDTSRGRGPLLPPATAANPLES